MSGRLGWIDLETTDLDPRNAVIVEVAAVVTTDDLIPVASAQWLVRFDPATMPCGEWPLEQHTKSGLLPLAIAEGLPLAQVEEELLAFLALHFDKGTSPMCGSSIQFDRAFLAEHMPLAEAHFHYRNIDVSSIKGVVERWCPPERRAPKLEAKPHRAMEDILASIRELTWYRDTVFVKP